MRGLDARVLRLDREWLELAVDEAFDHTAVVIGRRGEVDDDPRERVLVGRALVLQRAVRDGGERGRELAARDEERVQIGLALGLARVAHHAMLPARMRAPHLAILALTAGGHQCSP